MSHLLNIDHSVDELKSSCIQDIDRIKMDARDVERQLADLEQISGMSKLFHAGQIKKRKQHLLGNLAQYREQLANLNLELKMYKTYGKNIPKDEPNRELLEQLLDKRISKVEIILMVEMGMM